MKRRAFSTAASALLATAGWSASQVQAQVKKMEEGTDFLALPKPVAVEAPRGKVEVVEFFMYSCPHCSAFEPELEAWVKRLPKEVQFKRVPAAFADSLVPHQRLYYALEAMNKVDELHAKVFQAIHVERQAINTQDKIVEWVGKQGVDKVKFLEQYNSFSNATKARKATQLQDAYKVSGVPAMGIAGRFLTDGSMAGNNSKSLNVVEYLVAQVRQGR
jgi:thiol:disulfide interchange protein DsbA